MRALRWVPYTSLPVALVLSLTTETAAAATSLDHTVSPGIPALERSEDVDESAPVAKLPGDDRRFVLVPIPQSNPTTGSGLVLAAMYFYPQSEQQRATQPPSSTQGFGLYTDTSSSAVGVQHQHYWGGDAWRFDGILGYGDFNLDFFGAGAGSRDLSIGWNIRGTVARTKLLRRVSDNWYVGGMWRYLDATSVFSVDLNSLVDANRIETDDIKSVSSGVGLLLERDTRDNRFNPYRGSLFEADAVFYRQGIGSDNDYASTNVRYRYYRSPIDRLVLALDAKACHKWEDVPFYDLCNLDLRGFGATRYLDLASLQFQGELRWRFWKDLGVTAFGGVGAVAESFTDTSADELVESYGLGLRYMVLDSQRINVRLDFARSGDEDAVHLSVSEAF